MAFQWTEKPPVPDRAPTDDGVPVYLFDDVDIFRCIIVDVGLRFDDVLDHENLRLSLVRLMQIGNWRKDDGKLEYHIPASFNEQRPGFTYEHVDYAVKIGEHPIASKIPRPTTRPSIVCHPTEFRPLTRSPYTPTTIDDFLYSDRPLLSLRIVSFEDATLVLLSWPHVFVDALGITALFKNWIAVLEGREEDVQPLQGYDTDPLATLGTKPTESSVIAGRLLQGLTFFVFVVRYIFDLLWHPNEEARAVCLPAQFIQDLKQEALDDLVKMKEEG